MKNINIWIKENVDSIGNYVYIVDHPDEKKRLPEKKLNNVIKAFKCEDFYKNILAIQDGTLFGSSTEGLVFTGEKMIHHEHGEFKYSEIKSVKFIKDDDSVVIIKNRQKYKFQYLFGIDNKNFADFLNKIITEFDADNFKEEDQLKALVEMPEELKIAYLKTIINMTYIDDKNIDEKELAEIFLLMTRIELEKTSRFEVRAYITDISDENMNSLKSLLKIIKENSEASHYQSIIISLVKDLINTYISSKVNYEKGSNKKISEVIDECLKNFNFINDNFELFNLSKEQINISIEAIKTDYANLKEDRDDTQIEKSLKELSAKAAAAGTPLAAIYISGSVVGMSAAGITSGLATLGMGMGMTGGIAVVAIIGVLSYKGVKHLTGANELDKYKTRELMLHEILKQTQKTISLIIDDVNYVVRKLNDTLINHSEQSEKIKKLSNMVAQFQSALKSVDAKNNQYQNFANRLECPRILDESRLKSLTNEPTKKVLYSFIIENYDEKTLQLKENIETEKLDKMGEIFKALGYFEIENILVGKVKGIFG
ncbi:hypothetical protein [Aliarcobacter butzleri]|uniref:hypothetical protein n=1 Tax=Aliarcobacter butzleri TaxID=28197 RepID=UPI0021B4CDB1|nr:hypothetical protein [Aliarcobacter butzleri]MCT7649150.1 hypothetical protein [Aliarcobacter butzleri]